MHPGKEPFHSDVFHLHCYFFVFLVSVYSLVQELEDELKSNTFVWEWDVCQTQALIQEELVLSANVSPARIRVRILKVTWNRPGF